jgi:hypothetical protein
MKMKANTIQLAILTALALFAGRPASAEGIPPFHYPAELDIPYSADNPPGPSFPEAEKQRQLAAGQRIRGEILAAFNAGLDSYTIPAGDYRFGADWIVTGDSFALQGLHRSEDRPFRIIGYGATFWFNLSDRPAPSAHRMIKIIDCSHISLEGITIDSDPRGCMDVRITALDFEGNRLQVEPLAGTRLISSGPSKEKRFIPYKADGRHLSALYRIDTGWGPGNMFYKELLPTSDGRYWLTLENEKLLRTVRDDTWRMTYGSAGTLEVGDVLGLLYSTSVAAWLNECRQVTIRDCRFYAAKACMSETGGYGDHRWINCYFMARPGTNQINGGDGTMNGGCAHGSTFDGLVIQRTTDDAFNNHGFWRNTESVTEHSITFREELPKLLAKGVKAEIYHRKEKAFLGVWTVEEVQGRTVTFREPVGARCVDTTVIFPGLQNAGWVIRNSFFVDCYQRLLFQCGPGVFENNRVERVGSQLDVRSGPIGFVEGGCPDEVVIRNNLFLDSAVGPMNRVVHVSGKNRTLRDIKIENNLFCGSGREAVEVEHVAGLVVRDNLALNIFRGNALIPEKQTLSLPALRLDDVTNAKVTGNLVVKDGVAGSNESILAQFNCQQVSEEGNRSIATPGPRAEELLRQLTEKHDRSALEIISQIKREFDGK